MFKQMAELKKITENLRNQGKTNEQIKAAIGAYLDESKRKINPNGDLDIL
ncbi:hypothetical protein BAOM_3058 [Peribacillus asahii]|uniref:Uncharacterized protein n=1 Tax=Peribacillus asahii TaxID=228899 RepID=A0A3Q9RP59_9BACI|nr:hypothetical protein [Peribacillus asahii]AZV43667.1 hypothetical protein BAOM_3058 [Peribacillus asahii]